MADPKIRISAETAQAEAALKSLVTSITGLHGNLVSFAGVVGSALSVGAFANFIKSSIDLQNELGGLSKKTGITASNLSGLKFAADQNGASLEMVAKGVKEISINMSAVPDKFAKLGINAKDATGALIQIADLVSTMPDGMQKTALLAELMGKKVGPEMAEFMSIGGAAMRDYIERGKDIYKGTDENAAKAKEFKDQMAELEARTQGAAVAIASYLLPGLNETAKAMNELATEGHPVLALWRGLAGMGKVPWDLLAPPANLKNELSSENLIKDLSAQIGQLERNKQSGSGKLMQWIFGTPKEIDAEIAMLEARIETIKKHAAELDKPAAKTESPKVIPKAVTDLLASNERGNGLWKNSEDELERFKKYKKRLEDLQKPIQSGKSLVSGLSVDFSNDIEKKLRDINSPLMSGVDRQHADNLASVSEKAARVKESLDALNLTEKDRATLTGEINALTAVQADRMEALRKQIDANNSSWLHGAQTAMRSYLDEVTNVSKQSEALFTNAFKGMEDALVQFATKGKLDFSSLANSIVADMARIAIQQSITGPLMGMMMGAFNSPTMGPGSNYSWGPAGGMAGMNPNTPIRNANGNVFGFANGGEFTNGIFNQTTPFRFASGGGFNLGILGEAGPEAVMPLSRGSDGKLGVRAQGGGGVSISYAPTIQIDSRTDQAQVHQLVSNAVKRGNAELVDTLQRRGVI